jgi:hypothetical protein
VNEGIVLCEGYDDRAFWAGWLIKLSRQEPPAGNPVFDPRGRKVEGGHYGFYPKSDRFVRIVPCKGATKTIGEMTRRVRERQVDPFQHLVVCLDPDIDVCGGDQRTGVRPEDLLRMVKGLAPNAHLNANGDVELDGGTVTVSLVRWETPDARQDGLPTQQCLERLVCAAILRAYPDRGPAVQQWLSSRPDPPTTGSPKEHAWSHMAGWYAERGCDSFYRAVWKDREVAKHLEAQLRETGAWRIAEALVGPSTA